MSLCLQRTTAQYLINTCSSVMPWCQSNIVRFALGPWQVSLSGFHLACLLLFYLFITHVPPFLKLKYKIPQEELKGRLPLVWWTGRRQRPDKSYDHKAFSSCMEEQSSDHSGFTSCLYESFKSRIFPTLLPGLWANHRRLQLHFFYARWPSKISKVLVSWTVSGSTWIDASCR